MLVCLYEKSIDFRLIDMKEESDVEAVFVEDGKWVLIWGKVKSGYSKNRAGVMFF